MKNMFERKESSLNLIALFKSIFHYSEIISK